MNYRLTLISAILFVCALCSIRSFAEVVEIKGYHYNINKEEKAPVSDSPVNVSKSKNKITLFVPSISIDDYKGKEPWKSFGLIKSAQCID